MQTKTKREQLHAPYDWYRQMRETQPVYRDPDWVPGTSSATPMLHAS